MHDTRVDEPLGVDVVEAYGPYEVVEQVASGASGAVFRARHVELDRVVAVKELSRALRSVPGLLERFRAEAQVLGALDDPHVVRIYDYVEEPDRAWIVQEWVPGVSLATLLAEQGALSPEQSVGVLRGAVLGLAHAHDRGLVHRDVAPSNVLLDAHGVSKLVDFGLAVPVGADAQVCGTPAFMSPEAVRGEPVAAPADVYSAAAVLFTLLSGTPPYPAADVATVLRSHLAAPPPQLRGHGAGFAALLARAMAKEPAARPQHARDLLLELEQEADRRFGAGWLGRASVAGTVAAVMSGAAGAGAAGALGAAGAAGTGASGAGAAGAAGGGGAVSSALTTGAASTGAAVPAAATAGAVGSSSAPAAVPIAGQAVARTLRPRRLPVPKTWAAVAAVAAVVGAGSAVLALSGDSTPLPTSLPLPTPVATPEPSPTPEVPPLAGTHQVEETITAIRLSDLPPGARGQRPQVGDVGTRTWVLTGPCDLVGPCTLDRQFPGDGAHGSVPLVASGNQYTGTLEFNADIPDAAQQCGPNPARVTASVVPLPEGGFTATLTYDIPPKVTVGSHTCHFNSPTYQVRSL